MDGSFLPLVATTLRAGRTGTYAMNAEDFASRIMRDLDAVAQLRDHVLELTRARAVALRDAARVRMTLSGAEAACCIAILFLLVRGTQRTLSKPLDALSRRIVALSEGDVSPIVRIPGTARSHVNDALDELRGASIARCSSGSATTC